MGTPLAERISQLRNLSEAADRLIDAIDALPAGQHREMILGVESAFGPECADALSELRHDSNRLADELSHVQLHFGRLS